MSLTMTRQEREKFLGDVHVGIIGIAEDGRGPLTVPVWYTYDRGEVRVMTGRRRRGDSSSGRGASACVPKRRPRRTSTSASRARSSLSNRRISSEIFGRSRIDISARLPAIDIWRLRGRTRDTATMCSSVCGQSAG